MPSLNASISLALATKLRLLLETSADKFLSFPVGLAYPTSFFTFMDPNGGLSAVEQQTDKLEFARLTNMLPTDAPLFPPDTSTMLWDVYGRSLTESVFAQSSLNPAQNAQLDQAIDFLTDKQTIDGLELTVPSAVMQTYYQYKTVYDDLNRQYLNEKLEVEFAASDEAGRQLREAWNAVGERTWLDQLNKAEDDWISLGQRDTVRHYQSVRADLEPKRFPQQFKTTCQRDLELGELPDLNANGIIGGYATFFSPNNVFGASTPWPSLTLSKAEITSLAGQAPAALQARFGTGPADTTIERLSFEYNRVVLVRPWLNASFFTARSWTLPAGAVLSDGSLPRRGLLPAYVSSLIVVRNIRVTRSRTAPVAQPLVIPILSAVQMSKFVARYQAPPIIAKPKPWAVMQASTVARRISDPAQPDDPAPAVRTTPRLAVQQLQRMTYLRSTIQMPVAQPLKIAPVVKPVWPVQTGPAAGTRPLPTPPPQWVDEKFDFDGVVIIAFECVRLPKSPDPDTTLRW